MAVWKEGLARHEVLEPGIEVLRVAPLIGEGTGGAVGRLLRIVGWYAGVLWSLRGEPIACFNCHSLPVFPLSVFVKLWKRCVLVYEPHELETETAGLTGKRQWLARRTERMLIRFADAVCVVNRSIADWYSARYGLERPWVVRNVPYRSASRIEPTGLLRRAIGLPADAQLFLYQGLLAPGRGVPLLIEAFSRLPADKNLVFMGYGELDTLIQEAAKRYANIHFLPAVPPEQVKDYTVDADVGISLIENVCVSYFLCLPNKLFEYASCGVPVIVSDFPEMAGFVDEYDCGWKIAPEALILRRTVERLATEDLVEKRGNTARIGVGDSWQCEETVLLAMYDALGTSAAARDG